MKKLQKDLTTVSIYRVLDYFKPDNTIWFDGDERLNKLKNIIFNELTEPEKRILLLYADLGCYRLLAEYLNVSVSTAWLRIKIIKEKILEKWTN